MRYVMHVIEQNKKNIFQRTSHHMLDSLQKTKGGVPDYLQKIYGGLSDSL